MKNGAVSQNLLKFKYKNNYSKRERKEQYSKSKRRHGWTNLKNITALITNMRTLKVKASFTTAFFAAVNHNYDHKQRTLKHRNTQNGSKSTNHKSQPMTFWTCCFLRGPLRWLTAAKNVIVSWLLNFRIRVFVNSAVKGIAIGQTVLKVHFRCLSNVWYVLGWDIYLTWGLYY